MRPVARPANVELALMPLATLEPEDHVEGSLTILQLRETEPGFLGSFRYIFSHLGAFINDVTQN